MFDRNDIFENEHSYRVSASDKPLLRFWMLENEQLVRDRYLIIFDVLDSVYCTNMKSANEVELHAVLMDRLGNKFRTSVEEGWAVGNIIKSLDGDVSGGYRLVKLHEIPNHCINVLVKEINHVLVGEENEQPMEQTYRVSFIDESGEKRCDYVNERSIGDAQVSGNKMKVESEIAKVNLTNLLRL